MQYLIVGLTAVSTIVCLALSYFWYHSDGETDRRLQRRLRQEYVAAARRDLLDRQRSRTRTPPDSQRADDRRIEGEVEA